MILVYMLLASIIGAGATGAIGYYKGYTKCNQEAAIAILEGELEKERNEKKALEESNAEKERLYKESTEVILTNQRVIDDLREQIAASAKPNDAILDVDFLRRTDTIR